MASPTPAVIGPQPAKSCTLLALPAELILDIAQLLRWGDLSRLSKACHRLNSVLALRLRSILVKRRYDVLWAALETDNTARMRQAIAAGAIPCLQYFRSACNLRATGIIIILLDESKMDANDVNRHKHTPLLLAINPTHVRTIEALLARGADVNLGTTPPIMAAIQSGNLRAVQLLLQHGATVPEAQPLRERDDPVWYALFHLRPMFSPFVERGYHLEDRFGSRTALGWAVRFGCVGTVKLLLKHGSDVDQRQGRWDETPLHECCKRRGNVEMMTIFGGAGADADALNLMGQTPLQMVMCRGDVEAVRLLMEGTKSRVQRMCWYPVRSRNPKWIEGRQECWRILEEAGFYTSKEDIRTAFGSFDKK